MEVQYLSLAHDCDDVIAGKYKYIGMINKESKQPAGLGRLIQSAKRPKNIQEGLFLDGQRVGLVRFLGSDGDFSKVTFEGKTVSRR